MVLAMHVYTAQHRAACHSWIWLVNYLHLHLHLHLQHHGDHGQSRDRCALINIPGPSSNVSAAAETSNGHPSRCQLQNL